MEVGQKILISKGYVFKNYLKGTVIECKTREKKMTDVLLDDVIYVVKLENGEIVEISDDVLCNYTVIKDSEVKTHILYDKYTDGITNSVYYVVDMIKKFFRNLRNGK
ncbi:MAG: hypothetical protein MR593_07670 [Intestinibacter sp.]|uniref:hypothetical protein n=1 Tax=Intestinibacter sp. TaxID=1965304 RepID=UPI0025C19D37|nr:hypothetical protein [Intestinibacter sp.]MCI6737978.1 hypothetical protein [Intestinibacter sp.]